MRYSLFYRFRDTTCRDAGLRTVLEVPQDHEQ